MFGPSKICKNCMFYAGTECSNKLCDLCCKSLNCKGHPDKHILNNLPLTYFSKLPEEINLLISDYVFIFENATFVCVICKNYTAEDYDPDEPIKDCEICEKSYCKTCTQFRLLRHFYKEPSNRIHHPKPDTIFCNDCWNAYPNKEITVKAIFNNYLPGIEFYEEYETDSNYESSNFETDEEIN